MTRSKHKVHVGVCMWCTLELIRRSCNRDVTHDFYHAQFITIVKQISNVNDSLHYTLSRERSCVIKQVAMVCVNAAAAVADCFMYIMCRRPVSFWSVASGVEFYRVHCL